MAELRFIGEADRELKLVAQLVARNAPADSREDQVSAATVPVAQLTLKPSSKGELAVE